MIFVYALVDPRTDQIRYVGKTRRGMVRPKEHWDRYGLKRNDKCHRWVSKIVNLGLLPEVLVLEECSLDQLDDIERFWIASIRAAGAQLLNMTDGGEGGAPILDDISRAKLAHKGAANPFYGRKHSSESIRKMSEAKRGRPSKMKGVPKPPGVGEKVAAKLRGRKIPRERVERIASKLSRAIIGPDGTRYPSIKEAARMLGTGPKTISGICRGEPPPNPHLAVRFENPEHIEKRKWNAR